FSSQRQCLQSSLMSELPPCIYCGSAEPPREKREHVLPQSYRLFEDNWVLDCVCDSYNQYFGDKLELILGRDSSESILRLKYGLKPPKAAPDLLNRRLELTDETDGPWRGARAFMSMDLKGTGLELFAVSAGGVSTAATAGLFFDRRSPSWRDTRFAGPPQRELGTACGDGRRRTP